MRARPIFVLLLALMGVIGLVASACSGEKDKTVQRAPTTGASATTAAPTTVAPTSGDKLDNVYQYTQANQLAPSVRDIPTRVYVPNSMSN
ncbi:MAG TPA: hypothetical protein VFA62_04875, partial [Acidimicrobiia bacterium]|nr:hypothetical protein [Acidimicrobiia bacterium]